MDRKNRCQASIELMVVVGVLLMIFILVGVLVYRSYVKTTDLETYIFGTRLTNHIADNINSLNAVGEGYSNVFTVPPLMQGGQSYTIDFYNGESSIFTEGGGLSHSSELKYSSPISTSNIRCVMRECNGRCNLTVDNQCLQVNDTMNIRLAKRAGTVYLTQEYNVIQGGMGANIEPYYGGTEVDLDNPPSFVKEAGDDWNAIYIYRNDVNDTISLVFSLNLTTNQNAIMDMKDIMGDIVGVKSKKGGDVPEFNLQAEPVARWEGEAQPTIHGGAIEFKRGFSACIEPTNVMPTQDWYVLSSDGKHVQLEPQNNKEVCIAYP
jgi:hypothetical protein